MVLRRTVFRRLIRSDSRGTGAAIVGISAITVFFILMKWNLRIPPMLGLVLTSVFVLLVFYVKRAAYGSSKAGVLQLTKALAVEWAKYKINVNAVAPTFVETNLTSKMFEDEEFKKDVHSRILFDELPKPSDVVGGVLYLASNLSNYVTGETIKIDAGWTAI